MIKKIILILVVFLLGFPVVFCSEITYYSYGPGGLVAKTVDKEVYFYHKDHLGSTSLVSNSSGGIEYSSDYYPFGESYNSEGGERFTYTGKELDSSGLYYYGARYYDAVLGRFISVDPVKSFVFSPYVYVRDNPMKYMDPNGMRAVGVGTIFDIDYNFLTGDYDNLLLTSSRFGQGVGFSLGFSPDDNFRLSGNFLRVPLSSSKDSLFELKEKDIFSSSSEYESSSYLGGLNYRVGFTDYLEGSLGIDAGVTENEIKSILLFLGYEVPVSMITNEIMFGSNADLFLGLVKEFERVPLKTGIGPFFKGTGGYSDIEYTVDLFGLREKVDGSFVNSLYSDLPCSGWFSRYECGVAGSCRFEGVLGFNPEISARYDFKEKNIEARAEIWHPF